MTFLSKVYLAAVGLIFLQTAAESLAEPSNTQKVKAIALHGEPKYADGFTHLDYVNPNAPKGGHVTLPAFGTFDTLNPYTLKGLSLSNSPGVGMYGILETNEPLMVGSAGYIPSGDEPRSAYCLICEYIEFPADYRWVIFHINPNARFHNGDAITADDVINSYNLLISADAHPQYKDNYRNVEHVEKLSPLQVKFYLEGSDPKALLMLLGELPVMSKRFWDENSFANATTTPPTLSGAYKIESFKQGSYIQLKRVENHWAKDHPFYRGIFNFDTVRFDFFRDRTVAFEAFKSGAVDVFIEYIAKNWASAYEFPLLQEGKIIKEEIPHHIPSGTQAFFLNMRKPIFRDIRVRKALNYLFDFEWTNKNIFNGAYKRSLSYYPNSDMAATGIPDAAELALLRPFIKQLPAELLTNPFELPVNNADGNIRPQIRSALALFKEAGWVIKDKKLTNEKTGDIFRFEFLIDQPSFGRLLSPFIRNLEKAGIEATTSVVDQAQYKVRLDELDFDVISFVLGQTASPSHEQRLYFHSEMANIKGTRNYAGISNPVVDALVTEIGNAKSRLELITATRALDRVLSWNYYTIPHWYLDYHRIAHKTTFDRAPKQPDYHLGFTGWWIKK